MFRIYNPENVAKLLIFKTWMFDEIGSGSCFTGMKLFDQKNFPEELLMIKTYICLRNYENNTLLVGETIYRG